MQKPKLTRNALKEWNKGTFGNHNQRKKELKHDLMMAQRNLDFNNYKVEKKVRKELEILAEQEQFMWTQKSRTN